jgi:hypothetical protein
MFLRFPLTALLMLAGTLHAGDEKLVPAQFNPRTDSGSNTWDINPDGFIVNGNNDCFDSGAVLLINGNNVSPGERKQTEDGTELVLTARVGQLMVTRRILVDVKRQAVRYLELVTNTGNKQQQIALEVQTNLGNQSSQSLWNDGKPCLSGPLPKKCVALGAIPQNGDNRPGVVWIIGDTRAATPPVISITNQRTYTMRYNLELPPKQSCAILHYLLQRPGLQATQLADIIKPLWKQSLIKPQMPASYKHLVCNFRIGTPATDEGDAELGPRLPVIAALLERAGAEDTGSKTLVGVGRSEAERMTGSLSGGPLVAISEYGPVTIPVDELAGTEGSGFRTLLHLRNGETIAAAELTGALRLETEAGVELPVDPTQVSWLVAKRAPNEGNAAADQLGVLLLTDGSRLAVSTASPALPVISAFGQAAIALDQLASIERVNEPPGWLAIMRDGSRLRVLPAAKELDVTTCRFGARRLLTARIAGYLRSGKITPSDDERDDGAQLDSGERFYAGLAGATLTINANGADTAIPVERITAIERPENSTGLAVVLRDGGRLVGTTNDGTIALLAGGQTWRIPIRRLLQWQAPKAPEAPEAPEPPEADEGAKEQVKEAIEEETDVQIIDSKISPGFGPPAPAGSAPNGFPSPNANGPTP